MTETDPAPALNAEPGAKMMYLIKRKATTAREELVAHWFANHMPQVVQSQKDQAAAGKLHARRYIATLFDANAEGEHPWDGVAQLWFDKPLRMPEVAIGTTPTDTFQEKAEPYVPWATTEYVVIDGAEHLPPQPLTLNAPYPSTRANFFKITFLVKARKSAQFEAFFEHWLQVHVPNVRATMNAVDGFRYTVSLSIDPASEPFAGMAELYFPNASGWARYRARIEADGMEQWVDPAGTLVLRAHMEMIGLP